jgi:hypothetical protein
MVLALGLAACSVPAAGRGAGVSPSVPSAGPPSVEVIGGDEQSLRAFLERYLLPYGYGTGTGTTKVWIGRLPDSGDPGFPLPPNSSVVSSMQVPDATLSVILDVDQSADQVQQWYAAELPKRGWKPLAQSSTGGFIAGPQVLSYCRDTDGAFLSLTISDTAGPPADVRLSLVGPSNGTPCQTTVAGPGNQGLFDVIPSLQAPPGSRMSSGGAGSGDGYAEATATLVTAETPGELLAHFDSQLAQAGWSRRESAAQDQFAWSSWTLPQDHAPDAFGLLLILNPAVPTPDGQTYAVLRVVQAR